MSVELIQTAGANSIYWVERKHGTDRNSEIPVLVCKHAIDHDGISSGTNSVDSAALFISWSLRVRVCRGLEKQQLQQQHDWDVSSKVGSISTLQSAITLRDAGEGATKILGRERISSVVGATNLTVSIIVPATLLPGTADANDRVYIHVSWVEAPRLFRSEETKPNRPCHSLIPLSASQPWSTVLEPNCTSLDIVHECRARHPLIVVAPSSSPSFLTTPSLHFKPGEEYLLPVVLALLFRINSPFWMHYAMAVHAQGTQCDLLLVSMCQVDSLVSEHEMSHALSLMSWSRVSKMSNLTTLWEAQQSESVRQVIVQLPAKGPSVSAGYSLLHLQLPISSTALVRPTPPERFVSPWSPPCSKVALEIEFDISGEHSYSLEPASAYQSRCSTLLSFLEMQAIQAIQALQAAHFQVALNIRVTGAASSPEDQRRTRDLWVTMFRHLQTTGRHTPLLSINPSILDTSMPPVVPKQKGVLIHINECLWSDRGCWATEEGAWERTLVRAMLRLDKDATFIDLLTVSLH